MWSYEEFKDYAAAQAASAELTLEGLLSHARTLLGREVLDDDLSILKILFA